MATTKIGILTTLCAKYGNKMDDKELLWRLGQKIKEIREAKGITQEQISFNLDNDRANISRLESGRVNPRFITLCKVANQLNVSLAELIDIDYN
jgi:putative transcriptional regulator